MPMTSSQLAKMLTERVGREITTRQVGMWFARRSHNGFPEPVGNRERRTGRFGDKMVREANVWDGEAVAAWHDQYVPTRGGVKPGSLASRPRDAQGRLTKQE